MLDRICQVFIVHVFYRQTVFLLIFILGVVDARMKTHRSEIEMVASADDQYVKRYPLTGKPRPKNTGYSK
jgi:hypothetical protein